MIHGEACPRAGIGRMWLSTRSLWRSHVTSKPVTIICVGDPARRRLCTGPLGASPVAPGKSTRAETSLVGVRYAAEG